LQPTGIGTLQDAVIQSLEGDSFLDQLSLNILVPIDAKLGVVGKVSAELKEERGS
jgi:hypothetical protein